MRDRNTTFRQSDVECLIEQFMTSMDKKRAMSYFHHVRKVEDTFQKADIYMEEEIEPDLQDDNTETESEGDNTETESEDDNTETESEDDQDVEE